MATMANKKAPFLTIVDHIPWFDGHWSQFFADFDWLAVLISPLDAYISRYGDFCANDDDKTDCFTSCTYAQGNYKKVGRKSIWLLPFTIIKCAYRTRSNYPNGQK